MVVLKNRLDNAVPVEEMEDGQIAEIVRWAAAHYEGDIVQRYGDNLITVGKGEGVSWPGFFRRKNINENKVRILQKGEILEIQ